MRTFVVMLPAVLLLGLTSACGRIENEADSGTPAATQTGPTSDQNQAYTLRFSGIEPAGTHVGLYVNLAFTIDRTQRVRDFFVPDSKDAQLPGFLKSNDLADCESGAPLALESAVMGFARGELAKVDSIEVEAVIDSAAKEKGGVCFGYRTVAGSWTWKRHIVPFVYDAALDRWKAQLVGADEPTDAIKIAFGGRVTSRRLTRVTYNAHAPSH